MALHLTPEVTDEPPTQSPAVLAAPAAQSEGYEEVLINVRDIEELLRSGNILPFKRYVLTWRSRSEQFTLVAKLFGRDDVRGFIEKRMSNLAWLNKLRFEQWFTKTLVDYLVQRRCNSAKKDSELWFNLEGMMVRFSLREFVLCSRLNVKKDYEDAELDERMRDLRLISRLNPNHTEMSIYTNKVFFKDLEAYLASIHMEHPLSSDAEKQMHPDALESFVPLSVALTLGLLMFNHAGHNQMPARAIQLCNDIDFCNNYDWGTAKGFRLRSSTLEKILHSIFPVF